MYELPTFEHCVVKGKKRKKERKWRLERQHPPEPNVTRHAFLLGPSMPREHCVLSFFLSSSFFPLSCGPLLLLCTMYYDDDIAPD